MKKTLAFVLCILFLCSFLGCSKSKSETIDGTYISITDYSYDWHYWYSDETFMGKAVIHDGTITYKESSRYFHVAEAGPFTIEKSGETDENPIPEYRFDEKWNISGNNKHWTEAGASEDSIIGTILYYKDTARLDVYINGMNGAGYLMKCKDKDSFGHTSSFVIKTIEDLLMQDLMQEYKDVIGAEEGFAFCDKNEYDVGYIEYDPHYRLTDHSDYWYIEGYLIVDESKLYSQSSWESPNGKFKDEFRVILRYTDKDNFETLYFNMN